MKLKEAMKKAKQTGQKVQVTEKSDVKIVVNMRLDLDIVSKLKKEAEAKGIPYQTLINMLLKEHIQEPSLVDRVNAIENLLKKMA